MPTWKCDSCGQQIKKVEDGWVEWITRDYDADPRGHGLRLVHVLHASPRGKLGCQYDMDRDFERGEGLSDLGLKDFATPDGLMRLLVFIEHHDLPVEEVLEMIQRLHIPNYEAARPFMDEAVAEDVVSPRFPDGYFHQYQLEEILAWAHGRDA